MLGIGKKKVYMTEEERDGNMHILGTSGHGKSKLLEHLIREDINRGFGLCLIDPSDFAATYKSVLEYCASINYKKVCIIDPSTLYDFGKVACIQPLDPKTPTKSVQSVKDAINILFGSSIDSTPRIQENLDALLRMLAGQSLTLHEATYFTDYENPNWKQLLDKGAGSDVQLIREKFKSYAYWKSEFTTTVTRLNILHEEPLSLMIGADLGIDFVKMIDEGWVILCNLYPYHIKPQHSDFLGILIISQLNRAIEILNHREGFGEKGRRFYLYIDEAGRFATPQIENILSYNRKSGFNLIFAHHFLKQIKNAMVLDAIKNNTTIKLMFHMADDQNRFEMIRTLGFGGDITPQDAAHRYSNLPKRHFVIKKGKDYPAECVTPDVPKAYAPNLEEYIRERLSEPWYLERYKIQEQIEQRINQPINDTETIHTPPPKKRTVPNRKTNSDPPKTGRKSLLDFGDEAEKFIRDNSAAKGDD